MSLKSFHLFFIATALSMMAYTAYWAGTNEETPMAIAAGLGLAVGLPYSAWYLRRSRAFR